MKIGKLTLSNNLIMAPMAGITDIPFRTLAKEGGAGLVCTEMVSAMALAYGDKKTRKLMELSVDEHPVSVQIFGSKPQEMAEAAKICEDMGADIVDINFGCPVRKIVKTGAGSKAVENEKTAADIMEAVAKSINVPATIKIRTGNTPEQNIAPAMVKLAAKCGIKMVTVHARPAVWGHTGKPNLSAVKEAVEEAKIPVTGNGGITDEASAKEFLEQTGCAALMIGRAAIGDPELFGRVECFLSGKEKYRKATMEDRLAYFKRHAVLSCSHYGERTGIIVLRKVASYYLKGLPNASRIRDKFYKLTKLSELDSLLDSVWESPYFSQAVDFE
jgi:tRNA-dihydrouridine synthase B